ncbi:MAG TPA: hypothetical protein VN280_11555 [Variovorax sp.]|nr:hypothetical protein [Variovorax sp.]
MKLFYMPGASALAENVAILGHLADLHRGQATILVLTQVGA